MVHFQEQDVIAVAMLSGPNVITHVMAADEADLDLWVDSDDESMDNELLVTTAEPHFPSLIQILI